MNYHTNIRHQELVALLGSRNLYLRLVYAHIDNYTKVKGAWCGSQRDLAKQLELPIATINCQLTELLNKGLVVREMNKYRSAGEQKCSGDEQKCSGGEQHLYNMNNNIKKERENITRAQICATQAPVPSSFEKLLEAYTLRAGNSKLDDSTRDECQRLWTDMPEWKRNMLIARIQEGTWLKPRLEWTIGDFDPKPTNYNGCELPKNTRLVTARFNGKYGVYSAEEAEAFGMEDQRAF